MNLLDSYNYEEALSVGLERYEEKVNRIREYIRKGLEEERNRTSTKIQHPLVIWRNQPHTGMIDEYNFHLPNHTYSYGNGLYWDTNLKEAEWPYRYNIILRSLAQLHGDAILDAYQVSKDMIDYENVKEYHAIKENRTFTRVRIHADALHFCAGGLPRALLMPLADIIEHHNECRSTHNLNI